MSRFEGEQERIEAGEVLTPARKAVACDDQWLLELAVKLSCELGVHELRRWLSIELDLIFALGEDVVQM